MNMDDFTDDIIDLIGQGYMPEQISYRLGIPVELVIDEIIAMSQ
jgi:hypothetical protein